jgi:hypothetical protein
MGTAYSKGNGINIYAIILSTLWFFPVVSWYNMLQSLFGNCFDENREKKCITPELLTSIFVTLVIIVITYLVYFNT